MARQSSTEMITVVAISAGVIRSDRVSIPIWLGFIPNGFGIASVPFLLVKTITRVNWGFALSRKQLPLHY